MDHLEEIESYALAFADEIRKRFEGDITTAAVGLAQAHGQDSAWCEVTLWDSILRVLSGDEYQDTHDQETYD